MLLNFSASRRGGEGLKLQLHTVEEFEQAAYVDAADPQREQENPYLDTELGAGESSLIAEQKACEVGAIFGRFGDQKLEGGRDSLEVRIESAEVTVENTTSLQA